MRTIHFQSDPTYMDLSLSILNSHKTREKSNSSTLCHLAAGGS
jgi:hypothetical protein